MPPVGRVPHGFQGELVKDPLVIELLIGVSEKPGALFSISCAIATRTISEKLKPEMEVYPSTHFNWTGLSRTDLYGCPFTPKLVVSHVTVTCFLFGV